MNRHKEFVLPSNYIGPLRQDIPTRIPEFKNVETESWPLFKLPILTFDPGQTTGWSLLILPRRIQGKDVFSWPLDAILASKVQWIHGEINTLGCEDEAAFQMGKIAGAWPSAAIVIEDFILRAERKEKSRELLSPVRLIAKLESYLWHQQRKAFKQDPSQALPIVTNNRLALLNCLIEDGLEDHARDADRHAVLFVRRCMGTKGVAVKHSAWPHIYGQIDEMKEAQ